MATTAPEDVCLATNLDAFVLNEAVCESGLSRIAPITQPNYVSLRLNNSVIQHDLLPTVDLHNSQPALVNPRISKALTGDFQNLDLAHPSPALSSLSTIDRTRLGVYLHWTVPRAYRSGASQAPSADPSSAATANPNPKFRLVPNRWLLVRILREWAPQTAQPDQATAWIIESDKLRKIEELGDSVDLETDVTPFVAYAQDADSNSDILNNQAENYIGLKTPLAEWQGEHARRGDADRVPLTVMNSSNPLFADYAIHNPNVFSTKDNFAWGKDASGGPLGYLDMALCDYFVVGWHADTAEDPLGAVDANMPSPLRTRLSNLFCAAPANSDGKDDAHTSDTTTVQDNGSVDSTRIFCHAARYGVKFDKDDKTKPKTPADDYAAKFIPTYSSSSSPSSPGSSQSYDMEPVAVGTTPLDAVLAFFQAHEHDPDFEPGLFHDGNAAKTAQTLMELQELLYATEDDYDSRAKAADLIFQHNFTRNLGGSLWHYNKRKAADGPPATPSETKDPVSHMSELDYLNQLNECQQTWDAADRKLDQLRWALFAEFFKYVSDGQLDPTNTQDPRLPIYTSRIPLLRSEAVALQAQQAALQKAIDGITGGSDPSKALLPVKKIAGGSFFRRADPSLCLVGVDGGWDPQFVSGNTSTRYAHQLAAAGTGEDASPVKGTLDAIRAKLGPDLAPTVSKLLTESAGGYQPSLAAFGHKPWTEQPFCPQFVEWEGIYYHIDDSQWAVALANSALCDSNHKHVTYTNPNRLSDTPQIDQLHISGRMLVLPQPAFALDAVVAQVLGAALPQDLPPDLQTADQQAAFRQNLQSLKFISGQLTGLSDALLTMAVGQHVKPNVRQQGGTPQPIHAAVDVGSKYLHMTKDDFTLMAAETSKTPYGTLVDFTASNPHPFKAVQHGQFAITKLTIVDKFGQTITVPNGTAQWRPPRVENPSKLPDFAYPCLSEQLLPSLLDDGTLNTFYGTKQTSDAATKSGYPMTPFMQLTPAINQDARINSAFLAPVYDSSNQQILTWNPCSDWENPIIGWIIVNYTDLSLQFFTGSGIFYTALQFGGPAGILHGNPWLPFEPPVQAENLVAPQLDALIKEMSQAGTQGKAYFDALWDIISSAIPSMPFPPSDYAQYANAIVGKPLALVDVGWSLELAQPAYWPQHTLPMPQPAVVPSGASIDPLRQQAMDYLTKYPFPVKIGDADRPFDGVVAYWDTTTAKPLHTIYTYFPGTKPDDLRTGIVPTNYPKLSPYFVDPKDHPEGRGFIETCTAQMTVKMLLVDPYTPIHLYSGILPINSLQLPAWALQQAMKNMTAFFSVGPVLITKDVPKLYDTSCPLRPDTWISAQNNASTTNAAPLIDLPIPIGKGLWNWLQPYYTTVPESPGSGTPVGLQTHYNSLEVGAEDGHLRVDPAPYTFVEGFLQLARPLVQLPVPATDNTGSSSSAPGPTTSSAKA